MALATTCPHCKTSFKVVADQLKLRRGLVRCGKCQEVFSGVDYLRYIDEPRPRVVAPVASEPDLDDLKTAFFLPETMFDASVQVEPVTILPPVPAFIPSPLSAPSSSAREQAVASMSELDAALAKELEEHDEALNRVEAAALKLSRMPQGLEIESPAIEAILETPKSAESLLDTTLQAEHLLDSSATRSNEDFASHEHAAVRATRGARSAPKTLLSSQDTVPTIADRHHRPRRYSLLLCVLLLGLIGLVQGLLVMRHDIATQFPDHKVQLAKLIAPLGLRLELPRKYDALTIESFELQASEATPGDVQQFYAQALLRNRANHAVQWPAIELSLTDPTGQLLARKVLLAADYLGSTEAREQGFAPRSEKSVRVKIGLNQMTPNGYSAVLFYP